jgi:hypothetical protein
MRFRFTIRDLLWLTALAAVSVGWWLDHRHSTALYKQLELSTDLEISHMAEKYDGELRNLKDLQALSELHKEQDRSEEKADSRPPSR